MGDFTPVSALAGGLLIGTAAALLLWLNGRIAGVSNITNGLLAWKRGDILWCLLFRGGLVAGAGVCYGLFGNDPASRPNFPGWLLAEGGLLVGPVLQSAAVAPAATAYAAWAGCRCARWPLRSFFW